MNPPDDWTTCPECNGSGEGLREGSNCLRCRGCGEVEDSMDDTYLEESPNDDDEE